MTTLPAEPAIVDVDTFAVAFNDARRSSMTVSAATSEFDPEDNPEDTIYRVTLDGASGYAVRPSGELVYVFSTVKGRGEMLVKRATERDGANHLDCFDGYLPAFYARHGFEEWKREPNWTVGEPDVVHMIRLV